MLKFECIDLFLC